MLRRRNVSAGPGREHCDAMAHHLWSPDARRGGAQAGDVPQVRADPGRARRPAGAVTAGVGPVAHVRRVEDAYRSIHPVLWRALLAYTADREMASDAESEAFAQVLRRGDEVVDVASWVWRSAFAIARGMRAVHGRSTVRAVVPDRATEPSGSGAEFIGLLVGLSEQQRACVVLRHSAGMDIAAIATALNTSAGTVRVQLHRAHTSLQDEELPVRPSRRAGRGGRGQRSWTRGPVPRRDRPRASWHRWPAEACADGRSTDARQSTPAGPSDPAGYSSSGTSPCSHASSTGATIRQLSSASSSRTESIDSPSRTSSSRWA